MSVKTRICRRISTLNTILGRALLLATLAAASCQNSSVEEEKVSFGSGNGGLGDVVVAEIDGTKIYLLDLERTAASEGLIEAGATLTLNDPIFLRVLDEKIDQRLLALEALKQALDQEDETRRRLNEAKERILSSVLVEKRLSERVTETSIRRLYDEQALLADRGAERRARQIVVDSKEEALKIDVRLKAGESFAAIARDVSIDPDTKSKGGDLGFFARDMIHPVLTRAVFEADIGSVTEPIELSGGWYILKVEDLRRPKQPTFESLKSELRQFLTYEEMQKLLRSLRKNGEVRLLYGKNELSNALEQDAPSQIEGPYDEKIDADLGAGIETGNQK